jgi:glycosyltransferase involved in cell wall biosynthesis
MEYTDYDGELLVLQDGWIGDGLDDILHFFCANYQKVKIVKSLNNIGLAGILDLGIKHAKGEYLLRLDSDDEMLANRIQAQLDYAIENNLDVCGSFVFERNRIGELVPRDHYPPDHDGIIRLMKWRSPFAHPSTLIKRSAFSKTFRYRSDLFPEDYWLWYSAVDEGLRLGNIAEYLSVINFDQLDLNRRGTKFLKGEVKLFLRMYSDGFISLFNCFWAITSRCVLRSSPIIVRSFLYKRFR